MIREILIYLCTFVCVVSAGVVYWGMESNLKILSEIKKVLEAWAEGGGEVLDERYFCVCGEPVYAGEISCLKCGTPRPAYTRHPSKSEGGADER